MQEEQDCSNMRHKDIYNSAGIPHDSCKPKKIWWQALGVYNIGMENLMDYIYKKILYYFLHFQEQVGRNIQLFSFVSLFLVLL